MRSTLNLGLLCLSLFIFSLNGEEMESMEIPLNLDGNGEDFAQFQVAGDEEERNLQFHDSDIVPLNFRVKRQDNGKKPRPKKPRPGSLSTLSIKESPLRVRRQLDNTDKPKRKKPRPGMFSALSKVPPEVPKTIIEK